MEYFLNLFFTMAFAIVISAVCLLFGLFSPLLTVFVPLLLIAAFSALFYRMGKKEEGRIPEKPLLRNLPFLVMGIPPALIGAAAMAVSGRPLHFGGLLFFNELFFLAVPLQSMICAFAFQLGAGRKGKQPLLILMTLVIMLGVRQYYSIGLVSGSEPAFQENFSRLDYRPFEQDNKVVKFSEEPELTIHEDYPRLDGATAAFPVYSAMTELIYKGLSKTSAEQYVTCTTTESAFENLISGDIDIFFGAELSESQLAEAAELGVSLHTIPLAKEAFVFFVNESNPVTDLTVEEVQGIYQGRITNWKEVGGENRRIQAFQRNRNSGSQTVMEQMVMKGKKMMPPVEEVVNDMGGVIYRAADYRNYAGAIGYSFRYYATVMNPSEEIRILSVNGVEPVRDRIADGSYPFVAQTYAVVTGESMEKETVQQLLLWIQSDQGKRLIEACGYTAVWEGDEQDAAERQR